MRGLRPASSVRRVLALGAHADDIEIGAGGTIASLIGSTPGVEVHWVVFSAVGEREGEARRSARDFCAGASLHLHLHEFRDGRFPADWDALKEAVEALARHVDPDLVFTHRLDDRHQDHRLVAELTWTAFRDHLVLAYEIPKYEGDLGQPDLYVPLSPEGLDRKIELLDRHFGSQRSKAWFDAETFRGLARLRGIEAGRGVRYAEAFHCDKAVLEF